jgi:hypothetical protein
VAASVRKIQAIFYCAHKLQPIAHEMFTTAIEGQLQIIVGHLVAAAVNSYGALLTLVLNGYGHDAMKIARSMYEAEINIFWLKSHPEDVNDFLDYNVIQQKQLYDAMDEEAQKAVPKERYDQMMAEYTKLLPRFATGRDNTRPRNEWCRVSLYERAKEAEAYWQKEMEADSLKGQSISLYKTFYRHASSMDHLDISGIIAHMDDEMNAHMAPLWEHLEDALVATGSVLRSVSYFDEMAQLGLKERLGKGPIADYVAACKSLS